MGVRDGERSSSSSLSLGLRKSSPDPRAQPNSAASDGTTFLYYVSYCSFIHSFIMFSFIYHGHTVDVASDACWAALSQESVDWGAIDPNWAYTMLLEGKRAIHWTRNNTLKAQRQWRTVLINGKPLFVFISTPTLPPSLTNPAYSFWSLLISIATKMLIILFPRKHTWIVWVDTLIWRSALEWTMSSLHWVSLPQQLTLYLPHYLHSKAIRPFWIITRAAAAVSPRREPAHSIIF